MHKTPTKSPTLPVVHSAAFLVLHMRDGCLGRPRKNLKEIAAGVRPPVQQTGVHGLIVQEAAVGVQTPVHQTGVHRLSPRDCSRCSTTCPTNRCSWAESRRLQRVCVHGLSPRDCSRCPTTCPPNRCSWAQIPAHCAYQTEAEAAVLYILILISCYQAGWRNGRGQFRRSGSG